MERAAGSTAGLAPVCSETGVRADRMASSEDGHFRRKLDTDCVHMVTSRPCGHSGVTGQAERSCGAIGLRLWDGSLGGVRTSGREGSGCSSGPSLPPYSRDTNVSLLRVVLKLFAEVLLGIVHKKHVEREVASPMHRTVVPCPWI